jgi:ribosomal-protein-alanine N-acetyltransferase
MSVRERLLPRRSGGGVVIEPMRKKHVPSILPIERVSYPKPWSEHVFASELQLAARGERCYLVALEDNDVVAYAGMLYAVDEAHVTNIAAAPAHQRRGLATRLLAELSWIAIEHGSTAMTLEVRVSNTAAQSLYAKFGFTPAGVRQRYYENTEDAIVMWCHDLPSEKHRARLRELCPEAAR